MTATQLPPNYVFTDSPPSVEDYLHLRLVSGLSPKTVAQGTASVNGAWYGCYIIYTDPSTNSAKPVAMGRIISDGGWYFHIVDMAVLPDHQRKGLGEAILKKLLAHIKDNAPEGNPYISLLADKPGRKLYAKNGFVDAMPGSLGMVHEGDFS